MPPNPLEQAPSLFLRLHKTNPLPWRLWSKEVLAEAEAQNKPIFLSLGYGGCHWCHVMNQESFSDHETARLIADTFIPVLVDREEQPDVDQIYQVVAQLMGHAGGWPLNLFLTPKAKPFYATGYLPKEPSQGQTTFSQVVREVAVRWQTQNELAVKQGEELTQQLDSMFNRPMSGPLEGVQLDVAALRVGQRFDLFLGGLQGAMKFPSITALSVLWRAFLRSGAPQYMQLVTATLDAMLNGGLYDHVGGGFFRYTNDEHWRVPHFEKMLYDNAMLVDFMTQVWQFNRNGLCRQRVEETVGWMLRDLRLDGGFAGGIDADSEGEEGRYYLWSEAEIDAALAGTFSARFKQVYGVSREGNYLGRNILRFQAGRIAGLSDADTVLLARQRDLLLAARAQRVPPQRDDKLLTDWNGLTIHALAFAGAVFERADWIAAAIAAYDYIRQVSGDGDRLYHAHTGNHRGAAGFADDYALMARAALQLWEVTGEARFLADAKAWTATLNNRFWSDAHGGYCFTASNADPLIVRSRMIYDQPVPSSNGVMVSVLTKLALLTGEMDYRQRAQIILTSFVGEVQRVYMTSCEYLAGLECFGQSLQLVVVGPREHPRTQELMRAVWGKALPDRLLVVVDSTDALPASHPAFGKEMQNGQSTAYICQRTVAAPPITSAVTLSQALTLPRQRAAA